MKSLKKLKVDKIRYSKQKVIAVLIDLIMYINCNVKTSETMVCC